MQAHSHKSNRSKKQLSGHNAGHRRNSQLSPLPEMENEEVDDIAFSDQLSKYNDEVTNPHELPERGQRKSGTKELVLKEDEYR